MSKYKKELFKFLETATPLEIIRYWREKQGHWRPKHGYSGPNKKFIDLFCGQRLVPIPQQSLFETMKVWLHNRRRFLRDKKIHAVALAWRKYWRLPKINPRIRGEN
jgi:hypothetical protein